MEASPRRRGPRLGAGWVRGMGGEDGMDGWIWVGRRAGILCVCARVFRVPQKWWVVLWVLSWKPRKRGYTLKKRQTHLVGLPMILAYA